MKKLFIILSIFCISLRAFSQNFLDEQLFDSNYNSIDFDLLLKGYKENDREFQKKKITFEKTKNSVLQSEISESTNFTVSTGNSSIELDSETGTKVEMKPSATVTIPQANNLSLSASVPSSFDENGYKMTGANVKVSADLISDKNVNTRINNIENDRLLLKAERDLENAELSVESNFYTEISSIYDKASSVLKLRETYLTKYNDFEQIKVLGYTASSSKYKIAKLQKDSAYNECVKGYKELTTMLSDMSIKTGVEMKYLLNTIPEVQIVKFENFKMESFNKIEDALYNKEIGTLKRDLSSEWSLSANMAYDYSTRNMLEDVHTVGAGLSGNWKGFDMGVGISFPVTDTANPSLTFSASFNSATWRKSAYTDENTALEKQLEDLNVQDAYENYRETKQTYINKAENLEWENQILQEQNKYYATISSESLSAYKKGILSEADYINAENQYLNIKINLLKNILSRHKYNLEVKQLFTDKSYEEVNE